MSWETYPVTPQRFVDFADVINRNRRANHCWCLSHRLQPAEIERLGGGRREQAMRALCARDHPPGVVKYRDGEPVGWCNMGPRAEITRLVRSRVIRPIDDVAVWSIVCVIVRSGHRRQGVTAPLQARHHCGRAGHLKHAPKTTRLLQTEHNEPWAVSHCKTASIVVR